jgi:hypothetical protein
MVNVDDLNAAQDSVFADQTLWPKEQDGDEVTFCNLAALHVANGVGCHEFDTAKTAQPMRADAIYTLVQSSSAFRRHPLQDCQELVNRGALVLAILPSWHLHQRSGHVCTLTPGVGDHSGRWDMYTPVCMNLGRYGTCFRRKGVNWAFQLVPDFYMWVSP